jgi:hypothetical protein
MPALLADFPPHLSIALWTSVSIALLTLVLSVVDLFRGVVPLGKLLLMIASISCLITTLAWGSTFSNG